LEIRLEECHEALQVTRELVHEYERRFGKLRLSDEAEGPFSEGDVRALRASLFGDTGEPPYEARERRIQELMKQNEALDDKRAEVRFVLCSAVPTPLCR